VTPQQIADDLRSKVRGRLAVDELTRRLYSTDASPFQVVPAAVFVPVDEEDLAVAVKYAFERGLPLAPRGAGTGLAGESLNPGLMIDLSVHFREIREIGPDWVRAQAGVTLTEVNAVLARLGRRFAVDLPNAAVVTVGGAIGTNASGGTAFRHGTMRDHVLGLHVFWDSGEAEDVRRGIEETPRMKAVRELIAANEETIRLHKPRTPFSRAGYQLHDLLTPTGFDRAKLLVGSEGTLAITTEAMLATAPLVGGTAQYALGFDSLDAALAAGLALCEHAGIAGADLLDQRLVTLARASKGIVAIPAEVAAALVVTLEAGTEGEATTLAAESLEKLRTQFTHVLAEPTVDAKGCERIARFREAAVYGFYALGGDKRPEAFVEDLGVPPEELPAFIASTQLLLRDADLTASFLMHVLTGTIHCRPMVDLTDPADQARAWPLANAIHELALSHGGTISSQHGVGLARTPWIEKQFGPLVGVFRELKRILDPKGILNPGKIVGPDPSRPAWPFRNRGQGLGVRGQGKQDTKSESGSKPVVNIEKPKPEPRNSLTIFDEASFVAEVKKCNTCGDCRTRTVPSRMCPLFRVSGDEGATPRGMANALHAVLESESEGLADDDVKAVANHCIQCTRCRDECRAGIDIPHLMMETKAAHYAVHGFDRGEWLIARSERLAALAGTFAFTANVLLTLRPTRWLMEKLFGLSRKRMLHRFTHRTFLRRRLVQRLFRREGPGSQRKFAYFVDTFANFNDPLIAEATVAVLEHHGFTVNVPQRQRGSGMAMLGVGDLERARAAAAYNVRTLADLVRDGYRVVCSEPTAALALTTEYPRLLDSADANLVAENTVELTILLNELHEKGELKPPTRQVKLDVGHHAPCHLKALGPVATPKLLAMIPGLSVRAVDVGCSGMAGAWGLPRTNFRTSMAIGEPVFAAMDGVKLGTTECSACRMQLQQGTGQRVLHPVQLLALGYGLLPALQMRLVRPLKPRLTG
jgi:FAD/FMN-containing dehydrogenase/Fe-S oxidoreductase